MDTGRRPEEICALSYDCLARDTDGAAVLIYDNHKANRLGRRLPISAKPPPRRSPPSSSGSGRYPDAPIGAAQAAARARWRNPDGDAPITVGQPRQRHREWVDALPTLRTATAPSSTRPGPFSTPTGTPTPSATPTPVSRSTSSPSFSITATSTSPRRLLPGRRTPPPRRRRHGTARSFDRHGNRIWRDAHALLDSEHARYAVGDVAVPYGRCTEPSNVQAGGGACPVRFRCAGCDHFRTDVSLPARPAGLPRRPAAHPRTAGRHPRRGRRMGPRRRHPHRAGDHPHPPADQPDQRRHRRTRPGRTSPDRRRRRRGAPPPRRPPRPLGLPTVRAATPAPLTASEATA